MIIKFKAIFDCEVAFENTESNPITRDEAIRQLKDNFRLRIKCDDYKSFSNIRSFEHNLLPIIEITKEEL